MTITLFIILICIGGVVGYYSGLIGTGGNIILIPAFDILFHYLKIPENEAVKFIIAHSFFITVFTGLSVSYRQLKVKNLYVKEVLFICVPGMITAFFMTEFIKNGTWYHKSDFDLVFFSLLIFIAIRMLFFKRQSPPDNNVALNQPFFTIIGIVAGLVSSLSGLGGGIIVIPILTDILKISLKKASSISIGVVAMLAIPISANYLVIDRLSIVTNVLSLQIGYISLLIAVPVLIGVFFTTGWGVRTAQKTDPNKLRLILGLVILILCTKMIYGFLK